MYGTDRLMLHTARAFLAALSSEQREMACFRFEDAERFIWHFTPTPRRGIMLNRLTPTQQALAQALISSGYSPSGAAKAHLIMSLEEILLYAERDFSQMERAIRAGLPENLANGLLSRGIEPLRAVIRDPQGYYLTLFGEPSPDATWGWRLEGHHVSLNVTVVDGVTLVAAPTFFGSNPAEIRGGPRAGLRVLAAEEDAARELLASLNADQRARAVIDATAPRDILTFNHRRAEHLGDAGLPGDALTPGQRERLTALLAAYAGSLPREVESARMDAVRATPPDALRFAWMGDTEPGKGHYYRVQAPTFLVEYDCTQDNGNHIHSVWRDLAGDWGADVLGSHLATAHAS